jgi:serine/threonine protein kinase
MHGDLYAHNILFSRGDRALIGDFGAASVYTSADGPVAQSLQRLEVRAFGCLLEELIEKCTASPTHAATLDSLNDLKSACLSSDHTSRPLFQEINSILGRL